MRELKSKNLTKLITLFYLVYFFCMLFLLSENVDAKTKIRESSYDYKLLSDSAKISEEANINFKLQPKISDKFRYQISIHTIENNNINENKIINFSDKKIHFYYTEEVMNNNNGFITYKIVFDSIKVTSVITNKEKNKIEIYNSQIKDSTYNSPDYFQYNSAVGEYFFIGVDTFGEIDSIYGLEKIYNKLFDFFGENLSEYYKNDIKKSYSEDGIKSILQHQFQIFPNQKFKINTTWSKTYDSEINSYNFNNKIDYKIFEVFKQKNDTIVLISANLHSRLNDDINATDEIQRYSILGNARIKINSTRSALMEKESNTDYIFIFDPSFKSLPINKTKVILNIELLQ